MKTTMRLMAALWLLALVPLLSGCHNEQEDYISKYCPGSCTVIKGRITKSNGTAPMAGVKLLAQWEYSVYLSGSTNRKKAIATTDANGNYELRFLLRDDELQNGYIKINTDLDQEKYTFCQPEEYFFAGELKRNATIERDYALATRANLEFRLSNPEAIGPNNSLLVTATYTTSSQSNVCEQRIYWQQASASQQLSIAAGRPVELSILKTKSGQQTTETLNVEVQEGETRVIPLTF